MHRASATKPPSGSSGVRRSSATATRAATQHRSSTAAASSTAVVIETQRQHHQQNQQQHQQQRQSQHHHHDEHHDQEQHHQQQQQQHDRDGSHSGADAVDIHQQSLLDQSLEEVRQLQEYALFLEGAVTERDAEVGRLQGTTRQLQDQVAALTQALAQAAAAAAAAAAAPTAPMTAPSPDQEGQQQHQLPSLQQQQQQHQREGSSMLGMAILPPSIQLIEAGGGARGGGGATEKGDGGGAAAERIGRGRGRSTTEGESNSVSSWLQDHHSHHHHHPSTTTTGGGNGHDSDDREAAFSIEYAEDAARGRRGVATTPPAAEGGVRGGCVGSGTNAEVMGDAPTTPPRPGQEGGATVNESVYSSATSVGTTATTATTTTGTGTGVGVGTGAVGLGTGGGFLQPPHHGHHHYFDQQQQPWMGQQPWMVRPASASSLTASSSVATAALPRTHHTRGRRLYRVGSVNILTMHSNNSGVGGGGGYTSPHPSTSSAAVSRSGSVRSVVSMPPSPAHHHSHHKAHHPTHAQPPQPSSPHSPPLQEGEERSSVSPHPLLEGTMGPLPPHPTTAVAATVVTVIGGCGAEECADAFPERCCELCAAAALLRLSRIPHCQRLLRRHEADIVAAARRRILSGENSNLLGDRRSQHHGDEGFVGDEDADLCFAEQLRWLVAQLSQDDEPAIEPHPPIRSLGARRREHRLHDRGSGTDAAAAVVTATHNSSHTHPISSPTAQPARAHGPAAIQPSPSIGQTVDDAAAGVSGDERTHNNKNNNNTKKPNEESREEPRKARASSRDQATNTAVHALASVRVGTNGTETGTAMHEGRRGTDVEGEGYGRCAQPFVEQQQQHEEENKSPLRGHVVPSRIQDQTHHYRHDPMATTPHSTSNQNTASATRSTEPPAAASATRPIIFGSIAGGGSSGRMYGSGYRSPPPVVSSQAASVQAAAAPTVPDLIATSPPATASHHHHQRRDRDTYNHKGHRWEDDGVDGRAEEVRATRGSEGLGGEGAGGRWGGDHTAGRRSTSGGGGEAASIPQGGERHRRASSLSGGGGRRQQQRSHSAVTGGDAATADANAAVSSRPHIGTGTSGRRRSATPPLHLASHNKPFVVPLIYHYPPE